MDYLEEENIQLFELIVEDGTDDGVFANSFVETPAIERDFVFFSKQGEVKFQAIDEEKRLVAGPLLVPNKKIPRMDEELGFYNVFFTAETIEKIARKFMKNKYTNEVTVEHDRKVNDVYMTESWLIEQSGKDKSNLYGFTLPKGTWFAVYKVENDKVWQEVKAGKYRGFSIEGLFEHKVSSMKESQLFSKDINDLNNNEADAVVEMIRTLLEKRVDLETYADYGDAVKSNAKRGIELNEKVNNKCATQVGKVRAQQLANGEGISLETIKRMYSFLSRAETYYDESDTEACGTISFLLWGGKSALSWSRNKLKELGEIDLAVVGPRGGIVKAPKAPDSDTPNKNPKGVGTARGDASGKRAKVSVADEKTLEQKVKDFNERDSNTKNGRATLGQLKSVFQRGLGAFNTSSSPVIKSASAWAFARVNAYLYLLKNGRPENAKYITDNDLLPKEHPKYSEKLELEECPEATQNIALNLYNRQTAVRQANYGPLNPAEPNEEYWKQKAGEFGGSIEEAKSALCGNCIFFDIRKKTIDCIEKGIGYDNDPELVVEAGGLGYCTAFDFKCAEKRTCSAWAGGGPVKD